MVADFTVNSSQNRKISGNHQSRFQLVLTRVSEAFRAAASRGSAKKPLGNALGMRKAPSSGSHRFRHFAGQFTVKFENLGVVCHSQRGLRGVVIAEIPDSLFLIPNAFPRGFWLVGNGPVSGSDPKHTWKHVGNEKTRKQVRDHAGITKTPLGTRWE